MSSEHPEGAASPDEPAAPVPGAGARASLYVPRMLQQHLVSGPGAQSWIAEGTAAFADISGFTKLSEQLASKGREGAEQIAEVIGKSFEAILSVAYDAGGSLLPLLKKGIERLSDDCPLLLPLPPNCGRVVW